MTGITEPAIYEEAGESRQVSVKLLARNIFLVLLVIFLSLAAGFRWFGDGYDFYYYYRFYNNIPDTLDLASSRFEVGYQALAWFFRNVLNLDYEIFATFLVAIALGVKFFLFSKYLRMPIVATLLYLATFYALHEYTQVRSAVAISLGMLAIHLWFDNRKIFSAAAFLAGFVFHYGILILGAVFLASRYLRHLWVLGVAAVITILLAYTTDVLGLAADLLGGLNPLVSEYAYGADFYFTINMFSVQSITITGIAFYCIVSGIYFRSEYHARLTILLLAGIAVVPLFGAAPVLAGRLRDILVVPSIFLVCRSRVGIRELPMLGLMFILAAWQFGVALDEGQISFG